MLVQLVLPQTNTEKVFSVRGRYTEKSISEIFVLLQMWLEK
jgi:hypothetical protein